MTPPLPPQPYTSEEQVTEVLSFLDSLELDPYVVHDVPLRSGMVLRLAASLEELQRLREALRERELDAERWRKARSMFRVVVPIVDGVPAVYDSRLRCEFPEVSRHSATVDVDGSLDAARGVSSGEQKGAEG